VGIAPGAGGDNPRRYDNRKEAAMSDEYERLKEEYDDSPWTREELQALAWEAGKQVGWEDMEEYDDVAEGERQDVGYRIGPHEDA
jgi:hypothetical protein